MKILSTEGLTKLIQLIKSNFISKDDTVTTNTVTLADVATSGDFNDLINKPNAVTESTVSGWGFTKNTGTVTSVNNTQPDANGNVTIPTGGTVDQTYSPRSQNAQSGVAIASAKFISNSANNSTAISIYGNNEGTGSGDVFIGENSGRDDAEPAATMQSVAIGAYARSLGSGSCSIGGFATASKNGTAIGCMASALANGSIQLGGGTNETANTLQIGNYTLLNTSTGLIPDARLSSNIARTSQIPSLNGYATQTWVQNQNYITSSALNGYATQTWVQNQNYVKSVNDIEPDANGNVEIIIPTPTYDATNERITW